MNEQIILQRQQAYAEILEILKLLGNDYINKIPSKVIDYFEGNASKEYKFNIASNVDISKQIKNPITINLIGMLKYNYWCNNEEEKKQLMNKFIENDKIKEEALKEKYNSNIILKKHSNENNSEKNINTEIIIVNHKQSIFAKIVNKIKSILNKK